MIDRLHIWGIAVLLATALSCSNNKKDAAPKPVEITISCGAPGAELELCKQGAEAWAQAESTAGRPIRVQVVSTPATSTERLAEYQRVLDKKQSNIDVYLLDIIWTGSLAPHFLPVGPELVEASKAHFPAIVENNTVGGKLIAMPWFTDAGVLYMRQDLIELHYAAIPRTWEELTRVATRVQDAERFRGNKDFWGFVWQGRAYEGLTCNAVEWMLAESGGALIDRAGTPAFSNRTSAEALTRAKGWVGSISPPAVLNFAEEESRRVFQEGNALFMRNWPAAWSLLQSEDSAVKGKVTVIPLPRGASGRSATTLGGWQLAISRYSQHPKRARSLVKHLTSSAEQKRRAIAGGYHPTITALYQDPEIRRSNPLIAKLGTSLQDAVARPSRQAGARYTALSTQFFTTVHSVLSGKAKAAEALQRLDSEVRLLLSRK